MYPSSGVEEVYPSLVEEVGSSLEVAHPFWVVVKVEDLKIKQDIRGKTKLFCIIFNIILCLILNFTCKG